MTIANSDQPTATRTNPIDSFGVGCFHFNARTDKGDFDRERYYEAIEKLLNKSTNINDLKISHSTSFRQSLKDAIGGLTIWPARGFIEFKIMVPRRFQEKYSIRGRLPVSEYFQVRIVYTDNYPTAFVYSIDSIEDDPSTMVMVVRKHLEEIIGSSDDLYFWSAGPSPFHAEFFVYINDDADEDMFDIFNNESPTGYHKIDIVVPKNSETADFRPDIEARVAIETGVYYQAILSRNNINYKMSDLMRRIELASGLYKAKSWFHKLFSKYNTSKLRVDVEHLAIDIVAWEQNWNEYRSKIEGLAGSAAIISKRMAGELADMKSFPTSSYRNICEAMDSRTNVDRSNRSMLYAAIVSGIVSVLVTLSLNAMAVSKTEPAPAATQSQTVP